MSIGQAHEISLQESKHWQEKKNLGYSTLPVCGCYQIVQMKKKYLARHIYKYYVHHKKMFHGVRVVFAVCGETWTVARDTKGRCSSDCLASSLHSEGHVETCWGMWPLPVLLLLRGGQRMLLV